MFGCYILTSRILQCRWLWWLWWLWCMVVMVNYACAFSESNTEKYLE